MENYKQAFLIQITLFKFIMGAHHAFIQSKLRNVIYTDRL